MCRFGILRKDLKGPRANTSIMWRYFGALQQTEKPSFLTTIDYIVGIHVNIPSIALSVEEREGKGGPLRGKSYRPKSIH